MRRRKPTVVKSTPTRDPSIKTILALLDDAKAEEVVVIDVSNRTTLADAMIVASGRSNVHVSAIAERIVRAFKDHGLPAPRVEGLQYSEWVLIDAGDAIVHIFKPELRRFYNLEKLWGEDRPGETKPPATRIAR